MAGNPDEDGGEASAQGSSTPWRGLRVISLQAPGFNTPDRDTAASATHMIQSSPVNSGRSSLSPSILSGGSPASSIPMSASPIQFYRQGSPYQQVATNDSAESAVCQEKIPRNPPSPVILFIAPYSSTLITMTALWMATHIALFFLLNHLLLHALASLGWVGGLGVFVGCALRQGGSGRKKRIHAVMKGHCMERWECNEDEWVRFVTAFLRPAASLGQVCSERYDKRLEEEVLSPVAIWFLSNMIAAATMGAVAALLTLIGMFAFGDPPNGRTVAVAVLAAALTGAVLTHIALSAEATAEHLGRVFEYMNAHRIQGCRESMLRMDCIMANGIFYDLADVGTEVLEVELVERPCQPSHRPDSSDGDGDDVRTAFVTTALHIYYKHTHPRSKLTTFHSIYVCVPEGKKRSAAQFAAQYCPVRELSPVPQSVV